MLSTQQDRVICLLLAGKTQREAAQEVGIAEETVSRWVNGDAEFVAVLNARRQELWQANAEKLRALMARAIDALGDILESDDDTLRLKAAVAILRELDSTQPPMGPTDPDDVEIMWERRARIRELEHMLAGG